LVQLGVGVESAELGLASQYFKLRDKSSCLHLQEFISILPIFKDYLTDSQQSLHSSTSLHLIWLHPDNLSIALRDISPSHYDLPTASRISILHRLWVFSARSTGNLNPFTLRRAIWKNEKVDWKDIQESLNSRLSILHLTAWIFGSAFSHFLAIATIYFTTSNLIRTQIVDDVVWLGEWKALMREIMSITQSPSQRSPLSIASCVAVPPPGWELHTPFSQFLLSVCRFIQNSRGICHRIAVGINEVIIHWIEPLHSSGVDLVEFGKREYIMFQEIKSILKFRTRNDDFTTRYLDFDDLIFGPEPADWKFVFTFGPEHMAKQFWDMVERPTWKMPGTWVSEDDIDDDDGVYDWDSHEFWYILNSN
jgi:hypothetical protein